MLFYEASEQKITGDRWSNLSAPKETRSVLNKPDGGRFVWMSSPISWSDISQGSEWTQWAEREWKPFPYLYVIDVHMEDILTELYT